MRRIIALTLALLALAPATAVLAARQAEAHLCVVVTGAPTDVTAEELTEGIADGTYVVTGIEPCADGGGGGNLPPAPNRTSAPPSKGTGQWIVNPIERDPLTDEPIASTWVYADGSTSVALVVQCVSRAQTQVHIFWNAYLEMESARITTRIDDQTPISQPWPVDVPGTSSFYPSDELVFLDDLFGATRLVAQVKPWNQASMTVIFPVAGIEEAVTNVRAACQW